MQKNPVLYQTIVTLEKTAKKNKAPIWARLAEDLSAPTRQTAAVNVSKLDSVISDKETIVIPGKLLAGGVVKKAAHVVALSASATAQKKLIAVGGSFKTILAEVQANPKGANLRIVR